MHRPHLSDDIRERALAASDAGRSVADIARFCQTHPSTVYRWIRQRAATGSGLSRPRPEATPRIPRTDRAPLARLVVDMPDATIAQVQDAYARTYGPRIGHTTMRRYLADLGITR